MNNIFSLATPAADLIRDELFADVQSALDQMVAAHRNAFQKFWFDPRATPDEILASMGTEAGKWLQMASQSAGNIAAVAAIMGKSLDDLLPPSQYQPLREFIPHPDGTVTLAAAS
jgi:hypothetical protein